MEKYVTLKEKKKTALFDLFRVMLVTAIAIYAIIKLLSPAL